MKKRLFSIAVCVTAAFVSVFGQQTEIEKLRREPEKAMLDRKSQEREKSRRTHSGRESDNVTLKRKTLWGSLKLRPELKKIKLRRAPNAEDSAKYKDFLSQPKTGLFRLFPDFDCQRKMLVRVDGDCAGVVPDSWSYSFRRKDYSNDALFDVRLKDGNLISDAFHLQGILVDLGDVSLNEISNTSVAIKFLVEFKPQTQFAEVRNQFLQIEKGVTFGNYFFAKSVEAKENTAYAARLIAYKRQDRDNRLFDASDNEEKYGELSNDKRIDLIVVFRVVRKDADGSLTILWKELNRQDSPKLIFGESDKLSDIKTEK